MESVAHENRITSAGEAFGKQATKFDDIDKGSWIIQWMRSRVYDHIGQFLGPGSRILELNAGTGIDACHFASQGHRVLATDISPGMLQQATDKVRKLGYQNLVSTKQCSYTELDRLQENGFDLIFSNFGGLNCAEDFKQVANHLPNLINPGGFITLVMLSPVCIWETLTALKGNFKLAFRRFRKGGVRSRLEGTEFNTYYYSPSDLQRSMSKGFKRVSLEGLATFTPPPYLENRFRRWPKLLRGLSIMDEKTATWPILSSCGDHFIISFQFLPEKH